MNHDYIDVNVDDIPYSQQIELADTSYLFSFYQNPYNDQFYIDLYDYDGNLIKAGEQLVLNRPLWRNINNHDLPVETIVPLDESGQATKITADNLGTNVMLCIDDMGDD